MNDKKKFNAVDVIIIITVLLIISVSVFRALSARSSDEYTAEKNVAYTVTVTEIDNIYSDSLQKGDKVYLADKAQMCGSVSDFSTSYVYVNETITDENGNVSVIRRINPSEIQMNITVNTKARFADSLLYLGKNTYISEGQRIEFYTDTFTFTGIVSSFTVSEAE